MHFSVLEVYETKNQNSSKTFKKCETMSSTLSHLSESGKLFLKKTSLKDVHETRRKCIGNCSRANVLCKQFWARWWQGSFSISSEKGKIVNDSIARNCWRNAGETLEMILAWCTSPQKSYHDLKEIDTIPDASFVSSLKCLKSPAKLVAGIATNSILSVLL